MNQRDRDLLNKQFAWMRPAPRQISLKFGVTAAILLVGIAVGSTMVLHDPNATVAAAPAAKLPPILVSYNGSPKL